MPTPHLLSFSRRAVELTVCILGLALVTLPLSAQDHADAKKSDSSKGIAFNLSPDASAKDIGLPIYPGSKPYKEDDESSSALNMGMSGGSFGFKLAVMKLESTDSPEKVAAFYRKAMAKYGTVLDCSKATGSSGKNDAAKENSKSNGLTCEDDKPAKDGYTYKVGTKQKMHVVAVEPSNKNTLISLVYVEAPDDKDDKKDKD